MRLVTFQGAGESRLGVCRKDGTAVIPLETLLIDYPDMTALIAGMTEEERMRIEREAEATEGIPMDQVKLLSPIPHPRHDVLCVGQNYVAHAKESAAFKGIVYQKPDYPVYFSKRVNESVAPDGVIGLHSDLTSQMDYEVELAVIIGKTCSHVSRREAYDYVFGYSIGNDISARDIQNRHKQYSFGKGLDDSFPLGPWIVTRDDLPEPPHLRIQSWVNGELRQDSNTNDFIFDIPELISQLSQGITLEPGDILITGTPAGVGMGFHPPKFLQAGDVVTCRIEGIGTLTNTIQDRRGDR